MTTQTIQLSIKINATVTAIWDAIIGHLYYREGTNVFSKSHLSENGSMLLKTAPGGDTILCNVVRYSPFNVLSIEYMVLIKNGSPDYWHPETRNWAGLYEIYSLQKHGEGVNLQIEIDTCNSYAQWNYCRAKEILYMIKTHSERTPALLIG